MTTGKCVNYHCAVSVCMWYYYCLSIVLCAEMSKVPLENPAPTAGDGAVPPVYTQQPQHDAGEW